MPVQNEAAHKEHQGHNEGNPRGNERREAIDKTRLQVLEENRAKKRKRHKEKETGLGKRKKLQGFVFAKQIKDGQKNAYAVFDGT